MKKYNTIKYILLLIVSISLNSSCKTDKVNTEIVLSGVHKVLLLDSLTASKTIVKDDIEKFFDKIQPVDMMIQMKRNYDTTAVRDSILENYKKYIQADVENFTSAESALLAKTFNEAFNLVNGISTTIFPSEIKIIKTKGKHYGDDTYYTRENMIVIPKAAMQKPDFDVFLKVILHEISHIYTRTNPSKKVKLYAVINFKEMAQPLDINDSLRQRLLLNPDGIDPKWATTLSLSGNKVVFATPLIYANEYGYLPKKSDFFQYLGFNYYELTPSVSGKSLTILTIGNQQKSTLNTTGINTLFKEKFNTDYIIHPDEIIADNFAIVALSTKNPKILEPLTNNGKKLIEILRGVMRE